MAPNRRNRQKSRHASPATGGCRRGGVGKGGNGLNQLNRTRTPPITPGLLDSQRTQSPGLRTQARLALDLAAASQPASQRRQMKTPPTQDTPIYRGGPLDDINLEIETVNLAVAAGEFDADDDPFADIDDIDMGMIAERTPQPSIEVSASQTSSSAQSAGRGSIAPRRLTINPPRRRSPMVETPPAVSLPPQSAQNVSPARPEPPAHFTMKTVVYVDKERKLANVKQVRYEDFEAVKFIADLESKIETELQSHNINLERVRWEIKATAPRKVLRVFIVSLARQEEDISDIE